MTPYLALLIIVITWAHIEYRALRRRAFWIPLLILTIFATIRDYTVGYDSYIYTYNFLNKLDLYDFDNGREIGYQLLEYSLLSITHEYFWLFFLSSLFVVFSYLSFFKKYSVDYISSIFIFLTFNFYTFFFNGLRQGIAIAITIFSIKYIFEKSFFKFFIITFAACLFHKSAIIMIFFYFLINLNIKLGWKLFISFSSSLILSKSILNYLVESNDRYSEYAEFNENSSGLLSLFLYVFLGLIIYFLRKILKLKDDFLDGLICLYLLGVAITIPILILGVSASGPQRIIHYSTWILCILIPFFLKKVNNNFIYLIFFILCIVYFCMFTSKYAGLSPYIVNESFRIF